VDIFVRTVNPLGIVALEQRLARLALDQRRKLPDQIIDVLDAAIAAARPEWRYDMGTVAGEDHTIVHEALDPPALKRVERDPVDFEWAIADGGLDARDDVLGLRFLLRVGVGRKLQVDAIDIVRLLVQQRRLSIVERRLEPEPALGRR